MTVFYDGKEIARKTWMVKHVEACFYYVHDWILALTLELTAIYFWWGDIVVLPVYMVKSFPQQHHTVPLCVPNIDLPYLLRFLNTLSRHVLSAAWLVVCTYSTFSPSVAAVEVRRKSPIHLFGKSLNIMLLWRWALHRVISTPKPNDNRWHFGYSQQGRSWRKSHHILWQSNSGLWEAHTGYDCSGSIHRISSCQSQSSWASCETPANPPAAPPAQEKPPTTHASQS